MNSWDLKEEPLNLAGIAFFPKTVEVRSTTTRVWVAPRLILEFLVPDLKQLTIGCPGGVLAAGSVQQLPRFSSNGEETLLQFMPTIAVMAAA